MAPDVPGPAQDPPGAGPGRQDDAEEIAELERMLAQARNRLTRSGRGPQRPTPADTPIVARPPAGSGAPLSFQQEQLWFMDRFAPGANTYNVPVAIGLTGPVDQAALLGAVRAVVARHESLRSRFVTRDGAPVQVVDPPEAFAVAVTDLPAGAGQAELDRLVDAEASAPFDLEHGPLLRARLLRRSDTDMVLVLTTHHIVSDGWSTGLLLDEVVELYSAAVQGRAPAVPDLPVQYADFAAWQRRHLTGQTLETHLAFWERTLAGAPTLELPADRPRPAVPTFAGEVLTRRFPPELLADLQELSRSHGVSLFMTLLGTFTVLLARYANAEDIVVGTASAGRVRPELEPLVGFFTNMVVLRTDLSGDPTFEQVLARVRDTTLNAYEHQEVPFERVVARVSPRRDPSRNPLFQVAFGLLPGQVGRTLTVPGLRAELTVPGHTGSRFDISVNVMEADGELSLALEYASDLFDRPRMVRMLDHFHRLLAAVVADPTARISTLDLLTAQERRQVLVNWQGPVRRYRREPVHRLFVEQAARTPDAPAVVFDGESRSYAQLEHASRVLAGQLRGLGVGPGDLVGVAVPRGLWVPVALLGVLRAGAAFVPVDPSHPGERVGFVLSDADVSIVLTTTPQAAELPVGGWQVVCLDQQWPDWPAAAIAHTEPPDPVEDLLDDEAMLSCPAYVLYTSGSTGRPKGVVVEHHALATYVDFLGSVFDLGPADRMLQFSSLIFDLSEGEIFTALTRGATLVPVPAEATLSPTALSELMRREQVTYMGAPPAMIGLLDPHGYPALRAMLVGGEAFSGDLVNRWNVPGRVFLNAYGPTEATIGCTYHPCEHRDWVSSPPIGRAMPNRRVYLVDRWNNPVPVGVPGELLAAGEGLARGYLNRPDLTAQRFVPDPFGDGRAYHTGDIGYWTEDGRIQFVGRADTQIKLRGQRIELEEIEAHLVSHPAIAAAAVALRQDNPGDARLVAYLVPADPATETPTPARLRDHLGRQLPTYMLPSAYVTLDRLPLAATGKVDRAALPAPPSAGATGTYRPPSTDAQRHVAAAFAQVLHAGQVGLDDDFFALGGSSLQAALTLADIAERSGVTVPMRRFYADPTVAAIAAVVEATPTTGADAPGLTEPDDPLVRLRDTGSRTPLFCVPNVSGSAYTYVALTSRLDLDQPVYAFDAPGLHHDVEALDQVPALAECYLSALRARQPQGPYRLLGYSMGGLVAYEMATRLVEASQRVDLLVLIDSSVPDPAEPPGAAQLLQLFVDDIAGVAGGHAPRLDPALAGSPQAEQVARLRDVLCDAGLLSPAVGVDFLARRLAVFTASARAAWTYHPSGRFTGRFAGRVRLVRAERSADTRTGWGALCGRLDDHVVPGDHFTIWTEPNLSRLADTVRDCLDSEENR